MRIAGSFRVMAFSSPLLAFLVLVGCGEPSGPDPEPPFPAVGGSYDISGTFDAFSAGDANFVGTLTIIQPSRELSSLSGSADLTVAIAGDVSHAILTLSSASVTASGTLSFVLREAGTTATWTYTGTVAGATINGRHSLAGTSGTFSGNFSAIRTGAATVSTGQPVGATAGPLALLTRTLRP
jgi:hypothetical protein